MTESLERQRERRKKFTKEYRQKLALYAKNYRKIHGEKLNEKKRLEIKQHYFKFKSRQVAGEARHEGRYTGSSVTPLQLWGLWHKQKGICPLTGRRLRDGFQLDHIVPISKGGSGQVENLRWVNADANQARRNLSDEDFFKLCWDVLKTAKMI